MLPRVPPLGRAGAWGGEEVEVSWAAPERESVSKGAQRNPLACVLLLAGRIRKDLG